MSPAHDAYYHAIATPASSDTIFIRERHAGRYASACYDSEIRRTQRSHARS